MRETAAKIVAADSSTASDQHGALVRALGLSSKTAKLEQLRERLELLDTFAFHDELGNVREARHGERMTGYMKVARASDLMHDNPTDKQLRKRIERLLRRDL